MNKDNFQLVYESLNQEQRLAVDTIFGPVVINAGAGTGKTQLLSARVANILRQTDTLPKNILCLTYTDSATVNMRNRLFKIIGAQSYKVVINTFHSFSLEIINQYPEYFFQNRDSDPADELVQREILSKILENLPMDHKMKSYLPEKGYVYLDSILAWIRELKEEGLDPQKFKELLFINQEVLKKLNTYIENTEIFNRRISNKDLNFLYTWFLEVQNFLQSQLNKYQINPFERYNLAKSYLQSLEKVVDSCLESTKMTSFSEWKRENIEKNEEKACLKDLARLEKIFALAEVYQDYQKEMSKQGLIDFSDMLLEVIKCLNKSENARLLNELQEKFDFILVDEFQDTSGVQLSLLDILIGNNLKPNLLVVGDVNQTIYKFQGADSNNIVNFKNKYPQVIEINLVKNYRSKQEILDFAYNVIQDQPNSFRLISAL